MHRVVHTIVITSRNTRFCHITCCDAPCTGLNAHIRLEKFKSSLSVGTFRGTVCTCQIHVMIENSFINFVKTEDIMFNKGTLEIGSGSCIYEKGHKKTEPRPHSNSGPKLYHGVSAM